MRSPITTQQREAFWARFHTDVERLRDREPDCDVAINPFDLRRWNVKITKRRASRPAASVTLTILEHAPSTEALLLAVTPMYTREDVATDGERFLIPVLFELETGMFFLHADHGPVGESQMADFFASTAGTLLNRL